mmetsp:Transcript_74119/g.217505  ORF Transcript_74119/g.217505 Transcript_74119/m.217505 type:complete len:213 (+) Transcript_74119:435-1073(+)
MGPGLPGVVDWPGRLLDGGRARQQELAGLLQLLEHSGRVRRRTLVLGRVGGANGKCWGFDHLWRLHLGRADGSKVLPVADSGETAGQLALPARPLPAGRLPAPRHRARHARAHGQALEGPGSPAARSPLGHLCLVRGALQQVRLDAGSHIGALSEPIRPLAVLGVPCLHGGFRSLPGPHLEHGLEGGHCCLRAAGVRVPVDDGPDRHLWGLL